MPLNPNQRICGDYTIITGGGSDSSCGDAVIISSDIQQPPVAESIAVMRDIDLNIPIDLSWDSDCLPIDPEIGSENNVNLEVSSIPSSEICLGLEQEVHEKKRGMFSGIEFISHAISIYIKITLQNVVKISKSQTENNFFLETVHEGDEVSDIELVARNVNIEHPTGHLPPESVACSDAVPMGNTGNIAKDGIQDHRPAKSTHKKHRKMRLITDLLSENHQEPRPEQIAGQRSASHPPCNVPADSQAPSTLPDRVDVQEGMMTFRKRGRKRKFLADEESKKPAYMCFQRIENEVQNPQGDARTNDTVLNNISEDVLVGTSLQDGMKGHQHKPELERRDIMGEKGITEKEGASTEKGMDNFALDAPRIENESNLSRGKGKMLQVDEELDYLSCWKNDKLVEDAFAHTREKVLPNMPASVSISSAQGAPNGEGSEDGLHLSLNCYSSVEASSKKSIRQTKNWRPLSLTEGSSKHHLTREDSEPNIFTASRHITNAISGKGVHLEEIVGARNKAKTVQFYDLTMEELGEGAHDDVTMEVLELMGRNQYERSLPDAENRSSLLDKSTQMAKDQAGDRTNGTVRREENVLPAKGNSTNFLYPYGGNQFGLNNVTKTQSPFGLDVLHSKNKPSKGLYFSPVNTLKFGATGASRYNRGVAEHGSSVVALQARGVSNLRKSTLIPDYEASPPWPTLTSNAPLGFDAAPRQVVSQPTSGSNMNMTSHQSSSMHTIPVMNLPGLMGPGRQSATFFDAGVGAQMLQRAFYSGACSNNLRIGSATSDRTMTKSGKGESSKLAMQGGVSKQFRWPNLERKFKELVSGTDVHGTQGTSGPSNTISENLCKLNRNPADFTLSVERNTYTINGEDLKFEKGVPEEMSDLPVHGCKLKRNIKGKMKEHEKD
ncbi:hypothetical protein TanjilG_04472 [Lupinus angustifolius]|uniref:Uncharacterized protein n=1 Tax=Lupinus angustifolius TaxID=3871 RepID=A0A4P1RQ56_LUPAN|nr:hypothetical protein TanjilG_04472 [Lupinus angustifolius]